MRYAGDEAVNGIYLPSGEQGGKQKYARFDDEELSVASNTYNHWTIKRGTEGPQDGLYTYENETEVFPQRGWLVRDGVGPAPFCAVVQSLRLLAGLRRRMNYLVFIFEDEQFLQMINRNFLEMLRKIWHNV